VPARTDEEPSKLTAKGQPVAALRQPAERHVADAVSQASNASIAHHELADAGVPTAEPLASKYTQMEQQLATTLKQAPKQLDEAVQQFRHAQAAIGLPIAEAEWAVAQAQADLAVMR
jgi:hypothetical protein